MQLWAAQRFIDQAVKKFIFHGLGAWAFSAWLRVLGAKIGSYVTFRYCNALNVPDMLNLGDGYAFHSPNLKIGYLYYNDVAF